MSFLIIICGKNIIKIGSIFSSRIATVTKISDYGSQLTGLLNCPWKRAIEINIPILGNGHVGYRNY